jgi:hypothetical protein
MKQLTINDKSAILIKAKEIQPYYKSILYDCEGDKIWIPKSIHIYNEKDKTVLVEEWWYNIQVKEGKL